MYIAINRKLLRINPVKALRFAIRRETVLDILMEVSKKENSEDYTIIYVE